MSDVPVELLLAIVDWVEDNSILFSLRLASKTLNAVATPLVFRVITLKDSAESAAGLALLQNGGEMTTNAVQEIVFRGVDVESIDEDTSGKAVREALCAAFSGLAKFCNLKTLRLDFYCHFRELPLPAEPSHFRLLQRGLFAALAAYPPPPLDSLTLTSVIALPDSIYTQETFQNIFRPLTTLYISVLTDNQSHGAYLQAPVCDFWEVSIPSILRSAPRITWLTIRTNHPVGVVPASPLATIHFPALTTLSLRNFILDASRSVDHDVLEFIVRHKATLKHLALDACEVYGGETRVYRRPWHVVLQRLQHELSALRSFHVGTYDGDDFDEDEDEDWSYYRRLGYLFLVPGMHYHADDRVDTKADHDALRSLLSTVESR
ncbi:hypothetical protein B0H19DRAFT_651849 [Mycena capillaripes]|nr:hypothetical protein B0H19DRAFT_651849 [Mycena capillaripes]